MKQFFTVFKFELKSYLKNKVFVGITFFFIVAMVVLMSIPRLIDAFSDGGSSAEVPSETMAVKSYDEASETIVAGFFEHAFPGYFIEMVDESSEEIREKIESDVYDCAVVIESPTKFTYYVENLTMYDTNAETASKTLESIYRSGMLLGIDVDAETLNGILNVKIEGNVESFGKDQFQNFFYTYIMIFALYMVILLYGQMVATNVATEKSSRAMEVLVTSVKPNAMMFGKVFASCAAGLIQIIALFGTAIIMFNLNKDMLAINPIVASLFNIPADLFGYMIIFFILGFFIYAFLYGAIGSTASKLEDINTSVMPITLLFVAGFMVVIMSLSMGEIDNMALKICSYIPFTSPMAMFTRIAMVGVPWYEILISILILSGSVVLVGMLSAKIYRMGVLMYGTPPKFTKIIKMAFKK